MSELEKRWAIEELQRLADLKGKDVKPDHLASYIKDLSEYSWTQVKSAVDSARKGLRYFPDISQIIALISEEQQVIEQKLQEEEKISPCDHCLGSGLIGIWRNPHERRDYYYGPYQSTREGERPEQSISEVARCSCSNGERYRGLPVFVLRSGVNNPTRDWKSRSTGEREIAEEDIPF